MHGQACRRWSPRASIADRRLTQACTPGTRACTASPAEPVARPPFLGVGGRSSEPAAQSRGGRSETLFFSECCFLGPCVWYDRCPRSQRRRGGTRVWHRRDHGIKNQNNRHKLRKIDIASRSSLCRSPPFLFREMSRVGDPRNLKCPTPGKPALPAAPLVALQLSQHAPQPPRLHLSPRTLPSVRTLRLSLLQSLLAWLASPQPLERSLTTPGPPPTHQ